MATCSLIGSWQLLSETCCPPNRSGSFVERINILSPSGIKPVHDIAPIATTLLLLLLLIDKSWVYSKNFKSHTQIKARGRYSTSKFQITYTDQGKREILYIQISNHTHRSRQEGDILHPNFKSHTQIKARGRYSTSKFQITHTDQGKREIFYIQISNHIHRSRQEGDILHPKFKSHTQIKARGRYSTSKFQITYTDQEKREIFYIQISNHVHRSREEGDILHPNFKSHTQIKARGRYSTSKFQITYTDQGKREILYIQISNHIHRSRQEWDILHPNFKSHSQIKARGRYSTSKFQITYTDQGKREIFYIQISNHIHRSRQEGDILHPNFKSHTQIKARGRYSTCNFNFFSFGTATQWGVWPPNSWGF